jgi:ABC-type bacteriocin/lantibiotic exporter with double-glycine peptidase domain
MQTLLSLDVTRIVIAHHEAAIAGAHRVLAVRKGASSKPSGRASSGSS